MAEQTGVPEETVHAIVSFYWQQVRQSLSSLKHSRVHVTNLGDFVFKHWKMDDRIEQLERFEENNRLKGLQQMTARFKTAETLFDLRNLKNILQEEKQRLEFIRMHKRTTDVNKTEHNQDLEKQGTDH